MKEWQTIRLKYVADSIFRGDPPSYVEDSGIKVVNQACVKDGRLDLSFVKLHDSSDTKRLRGWLKTGDVLINSTGTGTLGRVAYFSSEDNDPIIADSHVTIIRDSGKRFVPKFLTYSLSVKQEELTVFCSEGATNQIELSRSELGGYEVLFPPIAEQQAIVDLLDRETLKIDRLVAEKENLLTLLAEKRRALISKAVTSGLNPDVVLRNSNLSWLGEIPAHWRIERAKWLFKERDERTENSNDELLTVSHITGVTPRSEKDVNMFEAETTEGYKICRRGDLAINTMWAWMGAMGVSPVDGIVSPSYNVYTPDDALRGGYLDALVRTPQFITEVTRYSKGVWSSRLRLYPEEFFIVWLPIPPLDEQHSIVEHIKTETKKLDDLRAETERTIGLLKERRAALIAAAVTGQLTVGVQV